MPFAAPWRALDPAVAVADDVVAAVVAHGGLPRGR